MPLSDLNPGCKLLYIYDKQLNRYNTLHLRIHQLHRLYLFMSESPFLPWRAI